MELPVTVENILWYISKQQKPTVFPGLIQIRKAAKFLTFASDADLIGLLGHGQSYFVSGDTGH